MWRVKATFAVLIAIGVPDLSLRANESRVIEEGMSAPAFSVTQLNGVSFSLGDRPTVIWFFADWCDYVGQVHSNMARDCDDAADRLKRGHETYGDRLRWIGLSIVSVASPQSVGAYRAKHQIPFAVAIDRGGVIFTDYGVRYFPTVVIVNKGKVVYRAQATLENLEKALAALAM